jgi:hypothetical protein
MAHEKARAQTKLRLVDGGAGVQLRAQTACRQCCGAVAQD